MCGATVVIFVKDTVLQKGIMQRLFLSYTLLTCISTVYCSVLDCVSRISYFLEMFYVIQHIYIRYIYRYICASPVLSGDFAWPWCAESPICMRLGCGESAVVALAAEMFSFF